MNDKSPPKIPFNRILSPVESNHLKFLILDCPTDQTLPLYIEEMKTRHVSDVVRVCEPTYNKEVLIHAGINVHDWPFKDGGIPPNDIVMNFLTLCDERFGGLTSSKDELEDKSQVIAVHCVAGLGRAPVLVAISLIESGMTPIDAIEFVRRRRRGAFNTVQLQYLMDSYKRQYKKSGKMTFRNKNSPSNSLTTSNNPPKESSGSFLRESLSRVFRFNKKNGNGSSGSDSPPSLPTNV